MISKTTRSSFRKFPLLVAIACAAALSAGGAIAQTTYNIDTFTGGTFLWTTGSVWSPDAPAGGPTGPDSIAIQGDLSSAATAISYATGVSGTVSITDISVTDTNLAATQSVAFQPGIAGSALEFATTSPTVSTNIVNVSSGAQRVTVANPLFQAGTTFTKGGTGNVRLEMVTTDSINSFNGNVTTIGAAAGGALWLSNATATAATLPDIDFDEATDTRLVFSGGAFTATSKTITAGSANATVAGGGSLTINAGATFSAGTLVMSSNNSNEFYLGGSSTVAVEGGSVSLANLNMGDQWQSTGSATYNQQSGTTAVSGAGYLGFPSTDNAVTQNLALNVSGGLFDFTTASNTDFNIGRNLRNNATAPATASTVNGTVTVSGTGELDLSLNTRMVLAPRNATNVVGNANGTLNLDGGTLKTGREIARGTIGTGTATTTTSARVFLNGGTLVTNAAVANLFTSFTGVNDGIFVSAGGAVFDTNGFDSGVAAGLVQTATSTGGGLTKEGLGTLTLSGSNSFTGAVTVKAGTLELGDNAALGGDTAAGTQKLAMAGGTLDLAGFSPTVFGVGGSTGTITDSVGGGTLTIAVNNGATGATLAGSLNLATATAAGRSYVVLQGNNTFTGTTSIAAGTLLAIESQTGLGASGAGQGTGVAGTLELKGPATTAFSVAEPLTITGGTIRTNAQSGVAGTTTLSGAIEVASGGATFNVNANAPLLRLTGGATGAGGITKTGPGTLEIAAASTYAGQTTISAGTLSLTGGNDRLATAGTALLNGSAAFDLGGNAQTLANVTANTNATAGAINASVGNGSLTVNGAGDFSVMNNATSGTLTVDMSGLSSLTVTKNANFLVQGAIYNGGNQDQTLVLSAGTNAITVNVVSVGSQAGLGAESAGVLQLGVSNTLHADTFSLGKTARGVGTIEFQAGLPGTPTVTIRNKAGTGRADVFLSEQWGGSTELSSGTLDFSRGTVDALLGTVEVGRNTVNNRTGVGVVTMGTAGGTIDATTVTLGLASGTFVPSGVATGTFTQNGATSLVTIDALVMGDNTTSGTVTLNATYNLVSGTLAARSIASGTGAGAFQAGSSRTIDWTAGTIRTYDAATDLAIDGVGGAGGALTINLLGSTHTFEAAAGRTIAVGVNAIITGSGGLTKAGPGTLTLGGVNTYSGATLIDSGTLALGAGGSVASSPLIRVAGGAGYDVSAVTGYALAAGQTLEGNGTVVGDMVAGAGTTIAPGASTGLLTETGQVTLASSGTFQFEINDVTGSAGSTSLGWDLFDVGSLVVTASSAAPYTIAIASLGADQLPGEALNWSDAQSFAWKFIDAGAEIGTFSTDRFFLDDTGFQNAFTGQFGIARGDDPFVTAIIPTATSSELYITYAAVPEPAAAVLAGIGGGLAAWLVRRRRRRVAA